MAYQPVDIGSAPNDGTGDPIRDAFDKCNDNFVELYAGLTGLLDFKGSTDCSANPNYPVALKGDAYLVSVAGKIGGASGKVVEAGDFYLALADNAGGTEASVGTSWAVLQGNITGTLPTDLDDLTDVNAPTPSDGDVLTWDSTPGEWVSLAPSGGIAELDDIPDVNAPTPTDGDVLTWDSTPGEWVASAPTGGSNALDDLTDVDAPTPTDGDVLTFDSGSGDWVPAAPTGGGGSSERTRVVPVVADFTLQNAGTASMLNVTSGIRLNTPSATSNFRFVRHNAALPATPWTMIALVAPLQPRTDTTQFQRCLAVRNSNGRMLMMHDRAGSATLVVDRWAGYTAPAATPFQLGATRWYEMHWQRITFDGTTFAFGVSPDGHNDTFYDFYTETAATYLTAAGGTISEVGWGTWTDSGPYALADLLHSFEIF